MKMGLKMKVVSLILLILVVSILTGCGAKDNNQTQTDQIQDLKADLSEQMAGQIATLKADLGKQMTDQIAALKSELVKEAKEAESKRQIADLQNEINTLKNQFAELEKQSQPYYPPPYYPPPPTYYPPPYYPLTQFTAYFYRGENFEQYVGSFTEPTIKHDWGSGGPFGLYDHFSARWEGTFSVSEAGRYRFKNLSDEGVRLWVDGHLLINEWYRQTAWTYQMGTIYLQSGPHSLKLEYFESTGEAQVELSWAKID